MPPGLLILSRAAVAAYEPKSREVCISISDPDDPPAPLSPKFAAVLRLAFSDIGQSPRLHRPGDVLFGTEHAIRVLDFIEQWGNTDHIVIHCTAGMSRSPGVALALCELQGWPIEELQGKHPTWNRWVRTELVRVGRNWRHKR